MAEFLSGGRIQGSSTADNTSSTFPMTSATGHSSYPSTVNGWYAINAQSRYDGTDKRVESDWDGDGTDKAISNDMTSADSVNLTPNSTKWTCRFKLNVTVNAGSPIQAEGNFAFVGLSSADADTAVDSSQDAMGFFWILNRTSSTNGARVNAVNSGSLEIISNSNNISDAFSVGIYYCQLVRDGDKITGTIWTGSYDGTLVGTASDTTANVDNLRYFVIKPTNASAGQDNMMTNFDDIVFYNGVTSATKDEKDDIINVPSGTRFEDTATRKIYRMTDNAISTANLKCYWTLGQASGDIPNSASTIGSSTAIADSELEKLGGDADDYRHAGHIPNTYSFNFDNSDGERLIASNASTSDWEFITNSGAVFTIAWWMKIDNNAAILDFLGTGGSGSPDFTIRYRGNFDDKFAFFFSTEGEQISDITLTDTDWHFYTVTYDDSVGTLTHTKDNTTTWTETGLDLTSTSTPTTANFALGDAGGSDKAMSGLMQEVSVWNRVLTSAEQTILYNSGTGKILGKHWAERGVAS